MAANRPHRFGDEADIRAAIDELDRQAGHTGRSETVDAADPRAAAAAETDDPMDPLDPEALDDAGGRSQVDELLDELVPPELDWRRLVRRYPLPALVVAGAAGYWLGRSKRGVAIAEAVAGAVALGVTRELMGSDFDEPADE